MHVGRAALQAAIVPLALQLLSCSATIMSTASMCVQYAYRVCIEHYIAVRQLRKLAISVAMSHIAHTHVVTLTTLPNASLKRSAWRLGKSLSAVSNTTIAQHATASTVIVSTLAVRLQRQSRRSYATANLKLRPNGAQSSGASSTHTAVNWHNEQYSTGKMSSTV
eukprot:20938-Heterococcus_DN1.PRE.2